MTLNIVNESRSKIKAMYVCRKVVICWADKVSNSDILLLWIA